MLGCMEPSEAEPVTKNYQNTAHTRRHIPIGRSVAGEGGVAHRSAQQLYWVAWSRVARDGFCGRGCDVLVSMFPRAEILIEREKKIGGAISCQHLLEHDNRRLILCLGRWSRLDSSTQQLRWVAWSPRRLHLLPTSIGIYFRLKLVLRGWSRLDLSTQQSVANTYRNMTIEG